MTAPCWAATPRGALFGTHSNLPAFFFTDTVDRYSVCFFLCVLDESPRPVGVGRFWTDIIQGEWKDGVPTPPRTRPRPRGLLEAAAEVFYGDSPDDGTMVMHGTAACTLLDMYIVWKWVGGGRGGSTTIVSV